MASGFGDLSGQEVAVSPRDDRLAYLSCNCAGSRVLRIGTDGKPHEAGLYTHPNGNNF